MEHGTIAMEPGAEHHNTCQHLPRRLLQQDVIEKLDEESDIFFGDRDYVTLVTLPLSSSGIYTLIKNSMVLGINFSRVPYK